VAAVEPGGDDVPAVASDLDRSLEVLARAFAVAGGLVLGLTAATVFVSVLGRELHLWSIRGEFELVEVGCATAVFLFLPICQQKRWHVSVDLFTGWLPAGGRGWLEALGEGLFALVWLVLAWRMAVGGVETFRNEDRSMVLHLPLWVVYLPAVAGILVSMVVALRNAMRLAVRRPWVPAP
jgi:TRAP-type C4-dicarboxylate transport system permease small subunit